MTTAFRLTLPLGSRSAGCLNQLCGTMLPSKFNSPSRRTVSLSMGVAPHHGADFRIRHSGGVGYQFEHDGSLKKRGFVAFRYPAGGEYQPLRLRLAQFKRLRQLADGLAA